MNAFQEAIKALLINARDEGLTRKQAAEAFGLSYNGLVVCAKRMGVVWPHAKWANVEPNERAKAILIRHEAGETLEAIGADYDITRERVRQIVKKFGGPSKTAIRKAKLIELADYLKGHPMMLGEAMRTLSLPASALNEARKIGGFEFARRPAGREAEMAPLADLVRNGMSIWMASGRNILVSRRLDTYCKAEGIKSRAPSRWSVSPERGSLVAELLAAGKSWAEIAKAVHALEGTTHVSGNAIYTWATRHMDMPRRHRKAKPIGERIVKAKPLKIAAMQPAKKPTEVELRETIRETAIVNRGKATAAEIADACGTTRNAVIGYWFRARQTGLVAEESAAPQSPAPQEEQP